MVKKGDMVRHNTLPPVEGRVMSVQSIPGKCSKVGVVCGGDRIIWDTEDTWDLCDTTEHTLMSVLHSMEDSDVIDVDFKELD